MMVLFVNFYPFSWNLENLWGLLLHQTFMINYSHFLLLL